MSGYIVSFCIPVYESAEVAYQIASDLLKSPDERFQVVISDDQSKDNTVSRLLDIEDSRLKVCVNAQKAAATLNWWNALENGDGEWLYLVMGRDKLRVDGIPHLIEKCLWAERRGIALMKDREIGVGGVLSRYNAYESFGMQDHPTGIIFAREHYRRIEKRKKYFESFDTYPEIGIACELIRHFSSAICDCRVFSTELYIDRSMVRSRLQVNAKSQFFFPNRRIQQIREIIDLIVNDNLLTVKERERLVLSRCYLLFMQVSEHWKEWMSNEENVRHYGLEKRPVDVNEEVKNIKYAEKEINAFLNKYSWYGMIMRLKIKREALCAIKYIRSKKGCG